jgi:hypothetical protein
LANTFFAYVSIDDTGLLFKKWIEFITGIIGKLSTNECKLIAAILTSSILPLIALGFIKSLVDYLKPDSNIPEPIKEVIPEIKEVDGIQPH